MSRVLLTLFLFALVSPLAPEEHSVPPVDDHPRRLRLAEDLLLPGFGAWHYGAPQKGAWIAAGRLLTLFAGYEFWKRKEEYASAERAASVAELFYGPGYRYKDPYGTGYKNSFDFRKEKERQSAYCSSAITLHAIITAFSLYTTYDLGMSQREQLQPRFRIEGDSVSLSLTLRDF